MSTDHPLIGSTSPNPGFKKKRFIIPIAFLVLGMIGGLTGCSSSMNSSTTTSADASTNTSADQSTNTSADQSTPTPADASPWYPSGYHEWSDGIAWQWAPNSSFSCTYSTGSCWAVNLIARDGCPTGVYAEVALLDSSDVQIDYTNDSSTNVPPMQKVRLLFDTFNEAASTARLSQIDCHGQ